MKLPGTWRGRALLAACIPPALLVASYIVLAGTGQIGTYRHPSGSMQPTLRCGDRYVVEQLTSRSSDPERGDIVAFHPPAGADPGTVAIVDEDDGSRTMRPADTTYVHRVIGLPGETVEIEDHRATIDGEDLDEPYVFVAERFAGIDDGTRADWGPKEVPKGTYLLLGDHRDNSADGRVYGFVPKEFLEGRVAFRYWPPGRIGSIEDDTSPGELARKLDPACLQSAPPAS